MRERLLPPRDHIDAAGLSAAARLPGATQHFFSGALRTRDRSKRMSPERSRISGAALALHRVREKTESRAPRRRFS
jgi:hypothetical protein